MPVWYKVAQDNCAYVFLKLCRPFSLGEKVLRSHSHLQPHWQVPSAAYGQVPGHRPQLDKHRPALPETFVPCACRCLGSQFRRCHACEAKVALVMKCQLQGLRRVVCASVTAVLLSALCAKAIVAISRVLIVPGATFGFRLPRSSMDLGYVCAVSFAFQNHCLLGVVTGFGKLSMMHLL